jgi:hypothetical protein
MRIGKHELHVAQRIHRAWLLAEHGLIRLGGEQRPIGGVGVENVFFPDRDTTNDEAMFGKVLGIFAGQRKQFFLSDALWHIPVRIQHEVGHVRAESGRVATFHHFAHHNFHIHHWLVVFHDCQGEIRDIDVNVARPEIRREGTPSFHIDRELLNTIFC